MKYSNLVEQVLLRISLWSNIVFTIVYLIVGLRNDSTVVIFDALYSLVCVTCAYMLSIFSKRIESPATNRFEFGYYKIEPMLIFAQAVVILFSCFFALFTSIRDVFRDHVASTQNFLEITIIEIIAGIIGLIICMVFFYYGKKFKNAILLSQGTTWFVDCIQSGLIALGFSVGVFIKGTRYEWISPYIDPVLMFSLVLAILNEPLKLMRINALELLDAAMRTRDTKKLEESIRTTVNTMTPTLEIDTILKRKAGRKLFIYVLFKKTPNVSLEQIAELKTLIYKNAKGISTQFLLIMGI